LIGEAKVDSVWKDDELIQLKKSTTLRLKERQTTLKSDK